MPTTRSQMKVNFTEAAPPGAADNETLAAATAEANPAKKQKLAPSDKDGKLHPTGKSLGYKGKNKDSDGITVLVQDFSEASECPLFVVVYMDKEGQIYSMDGEFLNLTCAPALHMFLQMSMKMGNTVVRFHHEKHGMQNGVHEDILGAMVERTEEKGEELDDDSFKKNVHDLVNALGDKFEPVENCEKTCSQHVDLHLLVHQCD